jgi:hypothetical protein
MPTLLEISNDLTKLFVRSKNKKVAARRIANHINCLQYSNTKQPIDHELKTAILQVMSELISGARPVFLCVDETIFITSKDVSSFNKLSGKILEMTEPGVAEREVEMDIKRQGTLLHSFTFSIYNVNSYVAEIGKYFKTKKQQ